jgi:ADP-heptose:LPS heptosyltransferase
MAALIEKLDLLITNDTGPMHIGFAMETPTFALFAPTDPNLCGPYKINHAVVIQKPQTCIPCLRKACASPFCMEQISLENVYEAIDAHLQAQ